MLKIGITGGIGSGKSTVCLAFKHLGIPVYSADDRARSLVGSDPDIQSSIIREFGKEAFVEGKYNRAYIAEIVFHEPLLLEKLNSLIHPAVFRDFDIWISQFKDRKYILHEAAILFESGSASRMDKTIFVDAPENLRIQRIIKRDNSNKASVLARIKNQWPADKIRPMADWIIQNNQKTLILPQILLIHEQLTK